MPGSTSSTTRPCPDRFYAADPFGNRLEFLSPKRET
jgi:hypothetical protein